MRPPPAAAPTWTRRTPPLFTHPFPPHTPRSLRHRLRTRRPFGVEQLLTVPYPLPPSSTRTAPNSARARSRPVSAAISSRREAYDPAGGATHAEVPTELPPPQTETDGHRPFLATSEQILVRSLPSDAEPPPPPVGVGGGGSASGGRLPGSRALVPPSSHTSMLSARSHGGARASATVNSIIANRRPASARAAGASGGQVGMFASRTERLERSLDASSHRPYDGVEVAEPAAPRAPDLV